MTSQTPWRADDNGDIRDFHGTLLFKNYSGHGKTTAKEQKENAEYIIKCVNDEPNIPF